MSLSSGTRLGVYHVVAKIGEGGMGEVYRARDTTLDRDVALKVLPDRFTSDADRLARFQREAKVLASLNHPNIAAIYGIEQSEDTRALVLELVEGPTLADLIAARSRAAKPSPQPSPGGRGGDQTRSREAGAGSAMSSGRTAPSSLSPTGGEGRGEGALPLDDVLAIATQIAAALEAAHAQGIIHRDLKPANIKVRGDGTVKVLDFGLAKRLPASETAESQATTLGALTEVGRIVGTPAYMSPEQILGQEADARSDIFSFGVVLYELLAGAHPFLKGTTSDTMAAVLRDPPTPPSGRTLLATYAIFDKLLDRSRRTGCSGSRRDGPGRTPPTATAALPRRAGARGGSTRSRAGSARAAGRPGETTGPRARPRPARAAMASPDPTPRPVADRA